MVNRRKKIISINTVTNNSTGRIMRDIQLMAENEGYSTLAIVGRRRVYQDLPCVKYGNVISFWIHVGLTTLFDMHGLGSYYMTKKMVKRIRTENPDIIHLHNIHGYFLNYPLLFQYLRNEYKGQIVWTLHDLWPITGHCAYYTAANCNKWKYGCSSCPNKKNYPISLGFDGSGKNFRLKKSIFSNIENMTITVPSDWMKCQLNESFLGEYRIEVIPNGINTSIFDYHRDAIDIPQVKKKYGIPLNKKIMLGVANIWDARKGFDDFLALSKKLGEDYIIVLVGLNKSQISKLPNNIIGIARTNNVDELVTLYSSADVFINPSREESFSLVTVEAMACGTPCVVADTSAVAELLQYGCGIVLHDIESDSIINAINRIYEEGINKEHIRSNALNYTNENMLMRFKALYESILKNE